MLHTYKNRPLAFVKEILHDAGRPYDKQEDILNALARHNRVAVAACNASGKDWTAARAILWWLHTRPRAKVVVTGATLKQIKDIVWHELRVALNAAGDRLPGKLTATRYTVDDDRFALAVSSNSQHNFQGFHSADLLVVVTEAQGVKQAYFEALKRLHPKKMLLLGNPLSHEGELYESHHAKSDLYHQIKISALDSPNFRRKRFHVPGLVTPADVEERRRDWGDDSPLYIASVLGQFPDALEDSLTTRVHVDRAVARWKTSPPSPQEGGGSSAAGARGEIRMGVDVARYGADEPVLCIRRGPRVERLIPLKRGTDTMQVADEVKAWADELRIPAVFVDEAGVGGGVVDRLGVIGVPVYGVDAGGRARRPSQFADLRAEIFWEVARLLREDAIDLPDDPVLISQLLALRYEISSAGRIRLESKTRLKKRGIPSPDRADALALAFMEPPDLHIWF